jgi:hypothetical protein
VIIPVGGKTATVTLQEPFLKPTIFDLLTRQFLLDDLVIFKVTRDEAATDKPACSATAFAEAEILRVIVGGPVTVTKTVLFRALPRFGVTVIVTRH